MIWVIAFASSDWMYLLQNWVVCCASWRNVYANILSGWHQSCWLTDLCLNATLKSHLCLTIYLSYWNLWFEINYIYLSTLTQLLCLPLRPSARRVYDTNIESLFWLKLNQMITVPALDKRAHMEGFERQTGSVYYVLVLMKHVFFSGKSAL